MPYIPRLVPPNAKKGQVLQAPADDAPRPEWGDQTPSTFRGEWAGDGELVYSQDFSASASLPPEFTLWGDYGPGFQRVQMSSAIGTGKPNYTYAAQFGPPNGENNLHLTLDLTQIAALAGLTVTRVVSRHVHYPGPGSRCVFQADGTTVQTLTNDQVWNTYDGAISPKSSLHWDEHFTNFDHDNVTIAGIEIYAMDPSFTYSMGEFVTSGGKMWKSKVDGNIERPGTTAAWEEALELPAHSGPTASRPSPATAGTGYEYFDTDLNRPIWVDATAAGWVDATGTAV